MKNNKLLSPSLLSLAITAALGLTSYSVAAAEDKVDTKKDKTEVIEVTGIRSSVIKAMDMKRDASGVMDAISSEDIGKMPDTNLAESLQRITGVSINRNNGEGSRVTVRGFGPDFNVITLNGRQMPAANLNDTSANVSRSFDFANLASESVAGVQVFKTSRAKNPTGGIGSVINIETNRPLNNPGLVATFGAKAVHDTSTDEGDSVTPELSGLYSQTFFDDTFGISISASHQVRNSANNFAGAPNGFVPYTGTELVDVNGNVDVPADSIFSVPMTMMYRNDEVERTRNNAQLTLQYKILDNLTATLDYTYAKLEVETDRQELSTWFNGDIGDYVDGEWEATQNPNGGPAIYSPLWFEDASSIDTGMGTGHFGTVNENNSIGLNLEWQANDNLRFGFDYHSSEAEANPLNAKDGTNNALSVVNNNRSSTVVDLRQDLPVLDIRYFDHPDGSPGRIDPAITMPSGSFFRSGYMLNEIEEIKLDGTYVFDEGIVSSVDFGISKSEVKVRSAFSTSQDNSWSGIGDPSDYNDDIFSFVQTKDFFSGIPGANNPSLEPQFLVSDLADIRAAAAVVFERNGVFPGEGACGYELCANPEFDTDFGNTEEITSLFLQANFDLEVGDMPLSITAGVRYEDTEITTYSLTPAPVSLLWVGDNEFSPQTVAGEPSTGEGDYQHVLPSIDFNLDLTDDIIARFSWGQSITRPDYGQSNNGVTMDQYVRNVNSAGTINSAGGNPALEPYEATNIDLSFEWYYDEGSYASVGYYRKDVDKFIANQTTAEVGLFDIRSPIGGETWNAIARDLGVNTDGSGNAAIRAEYWARDLDTVPGVGAPGDDSDPLNGDIAPTSGDPLVTFNNTAPANIEEVTIDGFEFAVQHIFSDTGFGVIANYTLVDSDKDYDIFDLGTQFVVPGLSDTANFVVFYDNYGFQARIAYNWRDKFLLSANDQGGNQNPIYTEEYSQIDANVSYNITENFTVLAEVINLTDEYTRNVGRTTRIVDSVVQQGARYNVGVRYKF